MAGITGMFCADGRPAALSEVQKMAAAIGHRGTDGIRYWNSGPVAFAHLQFCTTPESVEEQQPLRSPGGEACLVWDGRLDNRDELLEALSARAARPVDCTDPGLVLAAYLEWGTECVQRLVGDFALVIWDERERRLWCARDFAGIRSFYYFWDGKTFLFGPEVRALLAHPLVSLKINEGMVGEYMWGNVASRDETIYTDIRRLPSNSALTIDASAKLQIATWWHPELSLLQYRTDEEYAEQFLYLMEQSVLSRMRSNTGFAVEVSGGLDSSTIAVVAQSLLKRGALGQSAVHDRVLALSHSCPGKPWDEAEYITAVVEHAGLENECVEPLTVNLEFFRNISATRREVPGEPNGEPMTIPIDEAATRRGVRVLMSGIGGDEWLQGASLYLRDLIRAGAIGPVLERARNDWARSPRQRHWSIYLARQIVVMLTPARILALRRKREIQRSCIFSREFLRRTQLTDRLMAPLEEPRRPFVNLAQEEVFGIAFNGIEARALEWNEGDAASRGIEARFPYFDRRLTEYLVRIPEEQRQRGTTWKWMLRNATRGLLPEIVRMRQTKAEFSELYERVLFTPEAKARLADMTILKETDWLDHHRFAEQVTRSYRSGPGSLAGTDLFRLWGVIGVDLWLEGLRSSAGAPQI